MYVLRGVVADKTDAELFTIETSGADVTEGPRLRKRIWKPLKCEANLVNQSKTEPVIGRKPKLLKNRIKGKTSMKKRSSSMQQCNDSAKDSSISGNTQQNSQPVYSLWSTGKVYTTSICTKDALLHNWFLYLNCAHMLVFYFTYLH